MSPGGQELDGVLDTAHALAAAVCSGDEDAMAAALSDGATLWSSAQTLVPPCVGRSEVCGAIGRLLALRAPTRVRVLRAGRWSAVLALFADDEAIWSLEVGIDPPRIDSLMVWMTMSTRAQLMAQSVESIDAD